jgi:SAM-dependent methyltransferase
MAEATGGPVLELGCGSGRLLVPLARAGFQVTGIDNSAQMLARAESRLSAETDDVRARVRLLAADFTTSALKAGPFRLIVFGYNTFMHLDETTAANVLRQLPEVLRSDGRLLIDVENPFVLTAAVDGPEWTVEGELSAGEGETIRELTAHKSVPGEQAMDVRRVYEVVESGHQIGSQMRYHYLYPHQYELILSGAGFWMDALYGGYERERFEEDSERLILLARLKD